MGFFQKVAAGFRNLFNQRETISLDDERLLDWLGIHPDRRKVQEVTYMTCLKILSETMGKLPLKYYQDTPKGKIRAEPDSATRVLTVRPNPIMSPTTFWSTVEMNRQHYGNAFVWIRRKNLVYRGTSIPNGVQELWLLPTADTMVLMDDAGVFADAGGLFYRYTDPNTGRQYIFPQEDIMHFKTSITYNGILGKPVREIIGDMIDGAAAGQKFVNSMNQRGLVSAVTMEYTEDLDKVKRTKLVERYNEYLTEARESNGVIPVPPGLKLVPINMKLSDAQFFELRKYTALQIAAGFGVKPNHLNNYEKSSYANSEMQQLAFLVDTMSYALKAYEDEINYKILTDNKIDEGYWYRFNEKAILRTDSKTQEEVLTGYVNNGIYSPNEARELLLLPAKEGGDQLIVNGNYIPITMVGEQYNSKGGENE